MIRLAAIGIALFILWILLSGLFKPLLIGLGILSCLATMVIAHRMGIYKINANETSNSFVRFALYTGWLIREIAKSNVSVAKIIMAKTISLQQTLFNVPTSQKSDLGKVLFANSIILTPATITVETEDKFFLVHALTEAAADLDGLEEMDRRVTAIEYTNGDV